MSYGKDMFKHLHTAILFLIIYEGLILGSHSLDQSGFISLDCGLNENSTYTEETTSIRYISDAAFVIGGERKSVSPEHRVNKQQQVLTVRSFPEGIRNCYTTSTKKETKYLIRASFYYGNYDAKNSTPKFDLHLGTNFWDTIDLSDGFVAFKEVIHIPAENYVRVCLVNTGLGTPFISALELRPLKNNTYVTQPDDSLRLLFRLDVGSTTNITYRYPYDAFDRNWNPYIEPEWRVLSSSETVDSAEGTPFQTPNIVMNNAGSPANGSAPMEFFFDMADVNAGVYLYMHFAEIELLEPNQTRAFYINVNGRLFHHMPVSPEYLASNTVFTTKPLSGELRYIFTLDRLANSTLPPILNAFEVYDRVFFSLPDTDEDDVEAIGNLKSDYGVKRNWDGDPCLPMNYAWTGLNCSTDGLTPSRITSLDLSSSGLSGEISTSLGDLNLLETLDLSNNNLTGPVPQFLTQLPNLRVLNLRKNNLSGVVPDIFVQRSNKGSLSLSIEENQYLCSSSPCDHQKDPKKKRSVVVPIFLSVGGSLFLVALGVGIFLVLKKKKKQVPRQTERDTGRAALETKNRQFTYSEIVKMTRNFERVLGRGGFGTVYYGVLADGTKVAVKLSHPPEPTTGSAVQSQDLQRRKENEAEQQYQLFLAEVKLLLTVYHGKLTSLVGYCNQGINRALIYEFMVNGDLESHLSGKQGRVLSWETRLQIAIDSAQGLEYLHSGCKPPIIHRDIKTANILISENFQAKLADFGLSKFFLTDDGTHLSTMHIVGTPGYLDPDSTNGLLTEKSDVYSFGVVLLRIITGRPVIRGTRENASHLSQWVRSMLENGNIYAIIDQKLKGVFEASSAWKIIEIAMSCVSLSSSERPNMSRVVTELRECLALDLVRTRDSFGTSSTYSKSESLNLDIVSEFRPLAR